MNEFSEWVTIQIKRGEGYEDVCDELLIEDFMRDIRSDGWRIRIPTASSVATKEK